jgi:hypothetical protein
MVDSGETLVVKALKVELLEGGGIVEGDLAGRMLFKCCGKSPLGLPNSLIRGPSLRNAQ